MAGKSEMGNNHRHRDPSLEADWKESRFFGFTALLTSRLSSLASRPFDHRSFLGVLQAREAGLITRNEKPMNKTLKRLAATAMLIAVSFLLTSCVIISNEKLRTTDNPTAMSSA